MTGSSLNHRCAATEHESRAIHHCMTRCKYACLGSQVLPSPRNDTLLQGKGYCLSQFSLAFCSPQEAMGAANPTRHHNITSLWGSRILFNLWTPHKLINWSYILHVRHAVKTPIPNFATLRQQLEPVMGAQWKKTQECEGSLSRHFRRGAEGTLPELPLERSFRGWKENVHAQISNIDL